MANYLRAGGLYDWTLPGTWRPATNYATGANVLDDQGNVQVCTTQGISQTPGPPGWIHTFGGLTGDNTVVWTNFGVYPDPVSLAKEIETLLGNLVPFPPDDNPTPRRLLFIALANGILSHLSNNAAAFQIDDTKFPTITLTIDVKPS